jgi:hypothetical protein
VLPDAAPVLQVLFVEPGVKPAEQVALGALAGWLDAVVEHETGCTVLLTVGAPPALHALLLLAFPAPLALHAGGLAAPTAYDEQTVPVALAADVEHDCATPAFAPETEHEVELVFGLLPVEQVPDALPFSTETKPTTHCGGGSCPTGTGTVF